MQAEVVAINYQTGFAAARVARGITVFEVMGDADVREGELLTVDGDSPGLSNARNESGRIFPVYVHATECSDDGAVQLLFV